MRIEDYGLIGDLQTAALVGRNGSIDWLCFPRFDSGACFAALLGDESNGRWLLAPDCEIERVERRYRKHSLVHELDFHTEHGSVRVTDFMPPRGTGSRRRPHRRGSRGERADADGARAPLRLRPDRPLGAPARGRHPDRDRRPGRGRLPNAGPAPRREHEHGRRVHGAARRARPVRADVVPVAPRAAARDHARARLRGHVRVLERVAPRVLLHRPLRRGGLPLADGPEGDDVRADGRHRRRSDDLDARADRRRPQLGLPLLLAARRELRAGRAARERLRRRGGRVAELAAARRRRRPGRHPDHVRPGRRASADRARAGLAGRLRGLEAGPDRQRRQRPVPARRLRRGDRHALPGTTPRARRRRQRLDARPPSAREPRAALARARRRHLGGARAEAPLHTLQGDGVGGVRPRPAVDRRARPVRPGRPLARRPRRDQGGGARAGLRPGARLVRPVVRLEAASTRAC